MKLPMNSLTLIAICLCVGQLTLPAQDEPVQKLFTQLTWRGVVREIRPNGTSREKSVVMPATVTGACWITEFNGDKVIVTAAHNLGLGSNAQPEKLDGRKVRVKSLTANPVLGTLAYEVAQIGLPVGRYDVAFLRPADTNVFNGSRVIRLAEVPANVDEQVRIYGFPGTTSPQPKSSTIVGFTLGHDYMRFATPLDLGYSGGVVLNAEGKAIGVVVATESKQSTAIVINRAMLAQAEWKPAKDLLSATYDTR